MYVYKMLVLNRLREYKRLFSNMLLPMVGVILVFLWLGYEFFDGLLPVLKSISDINRQAFFKIQMAVVIYSAYTCFVQKKALIILKPMTIFLFGEAEKRRFIRKNIHDVWQSTYWFLCFWHCVSEAYIGI